MSRFAATLLALGILCPNGTAALQATPPDVRYRVTAHVDDASGVVTGTVRILYLHPGPSPLDSLLLRLGDDLPLAAPARARAPATPGGERGFDVIDYAHAGGVPLVPRIHERAGAQWLRVLLPHVLAAGDSVELTIGWRTRPSAAGQRIERRGRDLQLTGWYPVVIDETAVTEVLSPAYATHLVELDLAVDQVVAGTGVVLCGDPGWVRVQAHDREGRADPPTYAAPRDPAAARVSCPAAGAGRSRIAWYAEGVGEVVLALSPDFRYEEGDIFGRPVRALYRRGGERVWGAGLATRRLEAALAWTEETLKLGERYPWPQTTVIEALPGSAAAHAMVLLAESSSASSLLSLLALMVTEQMVSGGRRAFTRGTAAFHTAWYFEALGRTGDYGKLEREVLSWDLARLARTEETLRGPAPPSACGTTSCRRAEFMFHQLRRWADSDELVRTLYARTVSEYLLQPTPAQTFARMSLALVQPNPEALYAQLTSGGALYDYRLRDVQAHAADEGWSTTLTVERVAPGIFPQTVWVIGESDTVAARATALQSREVLSIRTRSRPRRVVLDPLVESHDWNMLDNQWRFDAPTPWLPWRWLPLRRHAPVDNYIDGFFSRRSSRAALTRGWAPTAWYNDAGGWTFGLRMREDYLGQFELNEAWLAVSEQPSGGQRVHGSLRLANPVWLFAPRWSPALELHALEGRAAASLGVGYRFPTPVRDSIIRTVRLDARWLNVMDAAWLRAAEYDDVATAELAAAFGEVRVGETLRTSVQAVLAGGFVRPGRAADPPTGSYSRTALTASVRRDFGERFTAGARVFAGAAFGSDALPRQRLVFWSHPDPWEQLGRPLLRSRGAILARPGVPYHDPGGVGVRGVAPGVASRHALGASLETELTLLRRPDNPLLQRAAVAGFADAGGGDGDPAAGSGWSTVADAGVGVRLEHRLGRTPFMTRLDLPLWLSRPELAQDRPGHRRLAVRWSFSLAPSF